MHSSRSARKPRAMQKPHRQQKRHISTKHIKKQHSKHSVQHQQKRSYVPHGQEANDEIQNIHSSLSGPEQFGQSHHTQRVKLLYRRLLRETYNWFAHNDEAYLQKAKELREQFESHRNEKDIGVINTLIKQGEAFLIATEDPNPYRHIMHPQGGVQWSRNYPPPREMLKPPESSYVNNRDYFAEERTIRHFHAAPDDEDYCKTEEDYINMQLSRGYGIVPNREYVGDILLEQNNLIQYKDDIDELKELEAVRQNLLKNAV